MKTMLLAVFGHYDSRGGTTGMPLSAATREAVEEAKRKYNLDVFGIETPQEAIATTAYGMEARKCDQIAHSIIYGDSTPGEEDLMYIAELHYPDDADLEGDLEGPINGEWGPHRRVLADRECGDSEDTSDEDGDIRVFISKAAYPSLNWTKEVREIGNNKYEYETFTDDSIDVTLVRPVQLELVQFKPETRYRKRIERAHAAMADIQAKWEAGLPSPKYSDEYYAEIKRRRDAGENFSYYDNPTYKALSDQVRAWQDTTFAENRKKAIAAAKVLTNPATCRWDDDAFGFIIGTGL